MAKTNEQINKELIEWINSNRKNKTRIVFEMQDKDDGNVTYKFTLGNMFDTAYREGIRDTLMLLRNYNYNVVYTPEEIIKGIKKLKLKFEVIDKK